VAYRYWRPTGITPTVRISIKPAEASNACFELKRRELYIALAERRIDESAQDDREYLRVRPEVFVAWSRRSIAYRTRKEVRDRVLRRRKYIPASSSVRRRLGSLHSARTRPRHDEKAVANRFAPVVIGTADRGRSRWACAEESDEGEGRKRMRATTLKKAERSDPRQREREETLAQRRSAWNARRRNLATAAGSGSKSRAQHRRCGHYRPTVQGTV